MGGRIERSGKFFVARLTNGNRAKFFNTEIAAREFLKSTRLDRGNFKATRLNQVSTDNIVSGVLR